MSEPVLLVTVAGERVAFPAGAITTVVELEKVTPVPRAPSHVSGITALRSRGMVVIDCAAALENRAARPATPGSMAVVTSPDGFAYALMVDEVHDIAEIVDGPSPMRLKLPANWQAVCLGQVQAGEETLVLVDPERIISATREIAAVA
ncbi:chemotaxis protein CheW [Aurantiacibacter poecillastricola]|uniref:chemotaxis protein CheW n=1 Tax=Aurantiacibacter poecillastricola TaxID=3064385 RepID=UPI00273DDD87|nr:chemotaxis protein CheW [Aurantiacibacter sp. 219JJ12-13]MDP5260054.1 chemotaxis protein CheW [Aurantiacibacter sp. 219JJ12-13]